MQVETLRRDVQRSGFVKDQRQIDLATAAANTGTNSGTDSGTNANAGSIASPNVGAMADDADIGSRVQTALLRDSIATSFDISVVTLKGDVRLTGVVDPPSQIDQSIQVTRGVASAKIDAGAAAGVRPGALAVAAAAGAQATSAPMSSLTALHGLVESLATIAFAASGLIAAARKRLDAVGVCIVAGLAAFGGGTLRDLLLDQRPFFWVQQPGWLWALLLICAGAMLFMRGHHIELTERAIQIPDAFGLGLYSSLGTALAHQAGMPAIVAVLMGITTAVVGGVLRDIVCNEIPRAFSDHQPYAVWAFLGGWLLLGLDAVGLPSGLALLTASAVTTTLRLLSMRFDWQLPAWQIDTPG
ncbi:MAG: TRIC cation channel family protein [Leptothrix sp. (in: b-proteobacteria)]